MYVDAFGVPVVNVNSKGSLEYMPGMMGAMMKRHGSRLNGMSRIYADGAEPIETEIPEAIGAEITLTPQKRRADIRSTVRISCRGNWLFKHLILKPDTKAGIRSYEANRGKEA